jgi:hypothetical protein
MRFTIRTAEAALKRSKPWDGYDGAAVPLSEALRRLGEK